LDYKNHKIIEISSGFFKDRKILLRRGEKPNNKKIYIFDASENLLGVLHLLSSGLLQIYSERRIDFMRNQYDLILIDEAHKFRNDLSQRWKKLRKLNTNSQGEPNKVILLTATPINNSVHDLYNLIRLFTDDAFGTFRMAGRGNISALFSSYAKLFEELKVDDDKKKADELKRKAAEIQKTVIDEVVLLRTRKYIKQNFPEIEIAGEKIRFTDPKPTPLDYSDFASNEVKNLYTKIAEILPLLEFEHTKMYGIQLIAIPEQSFEKDKDKSKRYVRLADIFRLVLGKRLESGIFAFEITLKKIYQKEYSFYTSFIIGLDKIQTEERLKEHLEKCLKVIQIQPGKIETFELEEEEDLEIEESLWFEKVKKTIYGYDEDLKKGLNVVCKHLKNDLQNMELILDLLEENKQKKLSKDITETLETTEIENNIFTYKSDPKLDALKNILGKPNKLSKSIENVPSLFGQKVIIFTQYKDTAHYIFYHLKKWVLEDSEMYPILTESTKTNHKERFKIALVTGYTDSLTRVNIKKRFAPHANKGEEEVDRFGELQILVTTDAFSEGVNLQDANAVINFDLPWNPMVIVQRVGRVNRIGNEKDVIVINFIPSLEVATLVSVLKRLQEKIKDITLLIGKESKILEEGETVDEKTFGQKIKSLAEKSMTELEDSALPQELKENREKERIQTDEFKLLQEIQFKRGYKPSDFEVVKDWIKDETPRYSFVSGSQKIYSIYELKRGSDENQKSIERKILTASIENPEDIHEESPLVLLKLLDESPTKPKNLFQIAEILLNMQTKNLKRKQEVQSESVAIQTGFLEKLSGRLKQEYLNKWKNIPEQLEKFQKVFNKLKAVSPQKYSSEIKPLLLKANLMEEAKNSIELINPDKALEILDEYFQEKGITDLDYSVETKYYGWFYST